MELPLNDDIIYYLSATEANR